jgi:hypothetical protein
MAKQPWEVPEPPKNGDATNDITFRAVGQALSQWEWFEGNLSLAFSYLIGSGYGNVAAIRAYGSVETFRGRANMIETAAEVYFRYSRNEHLSSAISDLLKLSRQLAGRRNDIAHGIVGEYANVSLGIAVHNGYVLYPAYYATRKRELPETGPLSDVKPRFIYSSAEIESFGNQFSQLAETAINILTDLTRNEQGRVHPGPAQ